MTLRKRIDRLDRGNVPRPEPAQQIVVLGICPETREAVFASIMGGGSLTRRDGETETDFRARVSQGAAATVFLPDNGR